MTKTIRIENIRKQKKSASENGRGVSAPPADGRRRSPNSFIILIDDGCLEEDRSVDDGTDDTRRQRTNH